MRRDSQGPAGRSRGVDRPRRGRVRPEFRPYAPLEGRWSTAYSIIVRAIQVGNSTRLRSKKEAIYFLHGTAKGSPPDHVL